MLTFRQNITSAGNLSTTDLSLSFNRFYNHTNFVQKKKITTQTFVMFHVLASLRWSQYINKTKNDFKLAFKTEKQTLHETKMKSKNKEI